jgi:purine-binding chemotaxis protein CheW
VKLVIFMVGDREYAVDIDQVREVIRLPEVIPIPDVPCWVEGIMDLRGEVIPVVSLRKRMGLEDGDDLTINRVLIAHRPDRPFGLIVDRVTGVIPVPTEDLSRVDDLLDQVRYIRAVARIGTRLLPMLDLPAMLNDSMAPQITAAGEEAVVSTSDDPLSTGIP